MWQKCECTKCPEHKDKVQSREQNRSRSDQCKAIFQNKGTYRICFMCWLRYNPPPVKRSM